MIAFASGLRDLGHTVTVLTGMPNYPHGVKPAAFRWRILHRETWSGIRIFRTYELATANKGKLRRTLNYLSFMLSAMCAVPWMSRQDVVIVTTPPLFVTVAARLMKRLKARFLVCDVRDVWPRSLYELGHARRDSFSVRQLERMEQRVYAASDLVVTATRGIEAYIGEAVSGRAAAAPAVHFSPNGISGTLDPEASSFEPEPNTFTIVYAGNHSVAQDLMQFIAFARQMQDESDSALRRVRFLFVGDGEERTMMEDAVRELRLRNVRQMGWIPKRQTYDVISKSDLCLVSLKDVPLFRGALPSKTFEYLFLEKPVLTNVGGELRDVLSEAGCGYFFTPHDYASFRETLLDAVNNTEAYADRVRRAKAFVMKHYDRRRNVERLNEVISELVESRGTHD